MASILAASGLGLIKEILDKFIPDPQQKANAILELEKLQQQSELAQIEVNKTEASSEDKYTSRARPTIMYICGAGFGYQYILQPFIISFLSAMNISVTIPNLDMTAIGTVLLGLCGLRSWDKVTAKK